ncbi:MAG: ribosome-associated translation inhibitor RaiA [Clostridiales bacterium]|jgi:putative sigma-54 modulation protein|nr:ribosome-associated translation inhibitor RaiA [Clostridiales bacterium]
MNFQFTGKNLAVSERLKEHTEKKIGRLARLFPENIDVYVTFSVVKQENKVEVSIPLNRRLLRAEVVADDMYGAIDGVVDVLERQRTKYKQRVKDRSRRDSSFKDEFRMFDILDKGPEEEAADDDRIVIERMKQFPLKPMDPEEAVMEMEMLGHSFYVFRHSQSFEVNVVYKRRGNSYGLICPNDPIDED